MESNGGRTNYKCSDKHQDDPPTKTKAKVPQISVLFLAYIEGKETVRQLERRSLKIESREQLVECKDKHEGDYQL